MSALASVSSAALEEQLRDFIVKTFLFGGGGDAIDRDYSFLEHGILDSMGVLELVAFLERRFGLEIADEEIVPENLDSLARLAQFVRRKGGA